MRKAIVFLVLVIFLSNIGCGEGAEAEDSSSDASTESDTATDTDSNTDESTDSETDTGTDSDSDGYYLLRESFETWPPSNWNFINVIPGGLVNEGWMQISNEFTPIPGFVGGEIDVPENAGSSIAFCSHATGGYFENDQWMVTPPIAIEEAGRTLSFWLRTWFTDTYPDHLEVLISTTDSNTTSFTDVVEIFDFTTELIWTEKSYSLDTFAGETIYVAFRENVDDNYSSGAAIGIDMVTIF